MELASSCTSSISTKAEQGTAESSKKSKLDREEHHTLHVAIAGGNGMQAHDRIERASSTETRSRFSRAF
jgi:hypothetical protein